MEVGSGTEVPERRGWMGWCWTLGWGFRRLCEHCWIWGWQHLWRGDRPNLR